MTFELKCAQLRETGCHIIMEKMWLPLISLPFISGQTAPCQNKGLSDGRPCPPFTEIKKFTS